MEIEISQTSDGSDTIFRKDLKESYHSTFGAITESLHIFINSCFLQILQKFPDSSETPLRQISIPGAPLNILEIGFGTGLNALLTLIETEKIRRKTVYTSLEPNPLETVYWMGLNYPRQFNSKEYTSLFYKLHLTPWDQPDKICSHFVLDKKSCKLETYSPVENHFHGVYFDPFSPAVQPELWTEAIFQKLFTGMKPGGILITYSVKGAVVRACKAAGFYTEKLPGPPGKRHILQAIK